MASATRVYSRDRSTNGVHASNRLNLADTPKRPASWKFEYTPGQEFPEVELGFGITAQLVWLTPEVAKDWLARRGKQQRKLKKKHLEGLTQDMLAGRFRLNGQTVVFDSDGRLMDGQHRATSVLETGIPVLVTVVRGIAPEAFTSMDFTSRRRGSDALDALGVKNTSCVSTVLRMVEAYSRGGFLGNFATLSPEAISELSGKYPGVAASASKCVRFGEFKNKNAVTFCHYVFSKIDAEDADTFFDRLYEGDGLSKGDPIHTLRRRLYRNQLPAREAVVLMFKAWNAWRRGARMEVVRFGATEDLPTPI